MDGYDLRSAVRRVLERSYARMARDMDPLESALVKIREDIPRRVGVDVLELDYNPDQVRREIVAYYAVPDGPSNYRAEAQSDTPDQRVYFIPADLLQALGGGTANAAAMARELNRRGYLLTPDKKNSLSPTMPNGNKIKHYRVLGTFFHERITQAMAAE